MPGGFAPPFLLGVLQVGLPFWEAFLASPSLTPPLRSGGDVEAAVCRGGCASPWLCVAAAVCRGRGSVSQARLCVAGAAGCRGGCVSRRGGCVSLRLCVAAAVCRAWSRRRRSRDHEDDDGSC